MAMRMLFFAVFSTATVHQAERVTISAATTSLSDTTTGFQVPKPPDSLSPSQRA